jgi:signal transduction histidine kinase
MSEPDATLVSGAHGIRERMARHAHGLAVAGAIALALAVLGAVGLHVYGSVERELTEAALARRLSVARLAAAVLTQRLTAVAELADSLATRPVFADLASTGRWEEAVQVMREVPNRFAPVDRIFLTDVNGTLMADTPQLPGVTGTNFADRDWYKGIARDWQPYVSHIYHRAAPPRRNVVAVAAPIRSRAGDVTGIIVLQAELATFMRWVPAVDAEPGGSVLVIDRKGRSPASPKSDDGVDDLSGIPVVQRLLRGESGVEIDVDPRDAVEKVFAYVPAERGWGVVTHQPARVAFAARDGQLRLLLWGYAVLLAFSATVIYLATSVFAQRRRAELERRNAAELERQVAERTAQLDAANKELESFSYSVSHDLRAPLRHIHGYVEMLCDDAKSQLSAEGRRCLGVIADASTEMAQLIDDLLAFSRMGRAELRAEEVDLDALVRESVRGLELATQGRNIEWSIAPLPRVRGDAAMLKQVFANLLGNAVKYSRPRDPARIEVGCRGEEHGRAVLFVRDNGVGFDMKYADKLFGIFQRLHRADEFEGTGVGLAIVRRIVVRLGGRVWAEAAPQAGATFYFTLQSLPSGVPGPRGVSDA